MLLYEKHRLEGGVWRENPTWSIGLLICQHAPACAVVAELRRSQGKGHTAERRLEMAREAACTCGSYERREIEIAPASSRDTRDMRDPTEVGEARLRRHEKRGKNGRGKGKGV